MNAQGSSILFYYSCGSPHFYETFGKSFLIVSALLACCVCISCTMAKLRYNRPYPAWRMVWQLGSCACAVCWGSLPFYYRFTACFSRTDQNYLNDNEIGSQSVCDEEALWKHLHYIIPFFLATIFYASNLPERFLPEGIADVVGQGHQIFHVLMSYMTLRQFDAAIFEYKSRQVDLSRFKDHSLTHILLIQLCVIIVDIVFLWSQRNATVRKCASITNSSNYDHKVSQCDHNVSQYDHNANFDKKCK